MTKKIPVWGWVVVGVLVLALIGSVLPKKPQVSTTSVAPSASRSTPAAPVVAPVVVSAEQVIEDYKANEISADAIYKGKILEVTGTIDHIGNDLLDTPFVALKGSGRFELRQVQCYFDKKDLPVLAKLTKGQAATIRGACDGLMMNVGLKQCVLVAP